MNSKSNKTVSLLMLLAGCLLVGFSMGRWLAPLAAWIGPILIIRYARIKKVGRGYFLIFAACILSFIIGFMPMWLGSGWPLPLVTFLPLLYGFLWSLPYLADRLMYSRFKGFSSTLVYPLAVTTLEFINIYTNPVGMWGATGFSQYGNLPLMQLASVTGMIGITFLMGWFASIANWAWENRGRGAEVLRGVKVFGSVLAIVYLFGFMRLNLVPMTETEETIRVAGITAMSQSSVKTRVLEAPDLATAGQELQAYWEAYFEETVREAQAGAQVIVWDEAVGVSGSKFGVDETSLITRGQEIARQNEIYLVLTLAVFYMDPQQQAENKLLVIDPTGAVVFEHIKYGGNLVGAHCLGTGNCTLWIHALV